MAMCARAFWRLFYHDVEQQLQRQKFPLVKNSPSLVPAKVIKFRDDRIEGPSIFYHPVQCFTPLGIPRLIFWSICLAKIKCLAFNSFQLVAIRGISLRRTAKPNPAPQAALERRG